MIDSLCNCYGVIAVEFSSFDDGTGVTEVDEVILTESSGGVKVYPSPFDSQITIEIASLNGLIKDANGKLYDMDAQLIKSIRTQIIDGKILFDGLEMLKEGMYYAIVEIVGVRYIVKIIK